MNKKKVAFICVHNSCRSQIAEALGKHLASDIFESYSAGTETKSQINQDAVRIMKEIYGIDMEANGQYSKLIADIPDVDIAISMGCNVGCPFIGRAFDDNWGLDDPTGKSDDDFKAVIQRIEENIMELKKKVEREQIEYLQNKMAAYQLYDTGLTVTKEDELLSLFICKYSSRISVLGRMSGRWVTTSCPCYSLSLAVEYKNDLGSLAFWLSGFLHSHLV